jgi:IPT/TIG domain
VSVRIALRGLPSGGRAWRNAALPLWVSVALVACGGDPPNQPTPNPGNQSPTISSVAPPTGTTFGGTTVTVTGTHFAAGATVTIGGTAASNVVVQNATTLTADTPQHAAGAADVSVTVAGRSASMGGAFTFLAPAAATNQPPAISGITTRGPRPGMPSRFADLDDTLTVTATVVDAETPTDQLKYEWAAESGAVSGTGRDVTWRAPAQAPTPTEVRLSLTVVETYQTVNAQGLPVTAEHRVPGSVTIRLHASAKEVRDLAVEFLVDFSQQRLSPEQIVRGFTDTCRGKADELEDVRKNQRDFTITSYSVEPNPPVEIAFGTFCRYRDRFGDACTYVPVRWQSTEKANGKPAMSVGSDQVNAVYVDNRWRLCDSDFIGTTTIDGKPSITRFKK